MKDLEQLKVQQRCRLEYPLIITLLLFTKEIIKTIIQMLKILMPTSMELLPILKYHLVEQPMNLQLLIRTQILQICDQVIDLDGFRRIIIWQATHK